MSKIAECMILCAGHQLTAAPTSVSVLKTLKTLSTAPTGGETTAHGKKMKFKIKEQMHKMSAERTMTFVSHHGAVRYAGTTRRLRTLKKSKCVNCSPKMQSNNTARIASARKS